jgi:hypothetical protein
MRNARTICISLEPAYRNALERLALEAGSRSEAVRRLLDAYEKGRSASEMERAYADYFLDPKAAGRERQATGELAPIASWPPENRKTRGSHGRRADNKKRA